MERQAMHPIYGVLQLHHNHLNIITQHLTDITDHTSEQRYINNNDDITPVINKLTRKSLKQSDDWEERSAVEYNQFGQYDIATANDIILDKCKNNR